MLFFKSINFLCKIYLKIISLFNTNKYNKMENHNLNQNKLIKKPEIIEKSIKLILPTIQENKKIPIHKPSDFHKTKYTLLGNLSNNSEVLFNENKRNFNSPKFSMKDIKNQIVKENMILNSIIKNEIDSLPNSLRNYMTTVNRTDDFSKNDNNSALKKQNYFKGFDNEKLINTLDCNYYAPSPQNNYNYKITINDTYLNNNFNIYLNSNPKNKFRANSLSNSKSPISKIFNNNSSTDLNIKNNKNNINKKVSAFDAKQNNNFIKNIFQKFGNVNYSIK